MNLKNIKNKNKAMVPVLVLLSLVLGVVIGQILYSNMISQTINVRGVDGMFDVSIDTELQSVAYKGDSRFTAIKIERINLEFESNWAMYIGFNHTGGLSLLTTHVTSSTTIFEGDHTTEIVPSTPTVFTQNGTSNIYARISALSDFSSYVLVNNTLYVDMSFLFSALAFDGDVQVSFWITDWI